MSKKRFRLTARLPSWNRSRIQFRNRTIPTLEAFSFVKLATVLILSQGLIFCCCCYCCCGRWLLFISYRMVSASFIMTSDYNLSCCILIVGFHLKEFLDLILDLNERRVLLSLETDRCVDKFQNFHNDSI